MSEPVRIYIGAPERGLDAESQMVCEVTLRKHASKPVEITWLSASEDPASLLYGWNRSTWATPFSGYRWACASIAKTGRAIYCDCDTIWQDDVVKLWDMEFPPEKVVAARGGWRYCVSVWEVDRARKVMLPIMSLKHASGHMRQNGFFRQTPHLTQRLGSTWNYLDNEDFGPIENASIIHYTDLRSQPSQPLAEKRLRAEGRVHWNVGRIYKTARQEIVRAFNNAYDEAVSAGYRPQQYY